MKIYLIFMINVFFIQMSLANQIGSASNQTTPKDYSQNPVMTIIGVDTAREQNPQITGKNVVVGILESGFNTSHASLYGKNPYAITNNVCWDKTECDPYKADKTNRLTYAHGNHVAGIILGAKIESQDPSKVNPYGIAYDAQYHGVGILTPASTYNGNLYNEFKDKKEIRIINNSWGVKFYPLINRYDADGSYDFKVPDKNKAQKGYQSILTDSQKHEPISTKRFFSLLQKEIEINQFNQNGKENLVMGLYKLSQERKVLNIFGAGNSGTVSPSAMAVIPSYDENIRSWLVVGAIHTHTTNKDGNVQEQYVTKENNKITVRPQGITSYTNHFQGPAQLYAVMAPGQYIVSSNAYYQYHQYKKSHTTSSSNPIQDGSSGECINSSDSSGEIAGGRFCYMSGTSMATPMVSGVAALVQEKYPFLNGAQIADVLLTTANKNIEAPKLIVKNSLNGLETQYTVIYISDYSASKTQDGKDNKENKVPLKSENPKEIDIKQVKKDLQTMLNEKNTNTQKPEITPKATSVNNGCKYNSLLTPECIINKLLQTKDENPNSEKKLDPKYNHNAILTLTKEEVFGQGILDANKALGGLAGLDANRLNLEDIQDFREIPRTQEVSKTEVSQQQAPQTQTLQATSVSIQAAQPLNTEDKNNANNAHSQLSQQEQERKSLIESTKQAFYTLDTTTDNPKSTFLFSNDISQRTW
ncbi:MAG: S8 family serine peptidase, partial [Helicobacter sp.]|nr:S8 family serine peptidase [Helicobacter sp.]